MQETIPSPSAHPQKKPVLEMSKGRKAEQGTTALFSRSRWEGKGSGVLAQTEKSANEERKTVIASETKPPFETSHLVILQVEPGAQVSAWPHT